MKSQQLLLVFFCFFLPSIYVQAENSPGGQTAIRSVVAQGGELRILLHVAEAGDYDLKIYSPNGEIVYQQTLREQAGEVEQKIPFGVREHGVYQLSLVGAGVQRSRQVMW